MILQQNIFDCSDVLIKVINAEDNSYRGNTKRGETAILIPTV